MSSGNWAVMVILLTLTACAGVFGQPLGEVGEVVSVAGIVRSVDVSPMAYDGPAEIMVDSQQHGRVSIYVQSCLGGCALMAVNQLDEIEPGEVWQATGEIVERGELAIYSDTHHSLEPR